MQYGSTFFRLGLVVLAFGGGYLVFVEHRYSGACRIEAERIEANFNETLPSSNLPYIKTISDSMYQMKNIATSHLTSWLFYVPAGKAITILHVSSDMRESALLEIPASEKEQRGQLYIQLMVSQDGSKIDFFGPQSIVATFKAAENSKVVLDETSLTLSSAIPNREIFRSSGDGVQMWRPNAVETLQCSPTTTVVLCKWVEQEDDGNSVLIERPHALKIIGK
jgi:hypothetical protein